MVTRNPVKANWISLGEYRSSPSISRHYFIYVTPEDLNMDINFEAEFVIEIYNNGSSNACVIITYIRLKVWCVYGV